MADVTLATPLPLRGADQTVESPTRRALRRLLRRRGAMVGLAVIAAFILLALFAPFVSPHDPIAQSWLAVRKPPWRIALFHILPNILPALLVQATLSIAAAIIAEAALSFLGLGQQPPAPSWGSMLNSAQRFLVNAPWMAIWPGFAIFVTVLSFNLLGDGLRDALDPRER